MSETEQTPPRKVNMTTAVNNEPQDSSLGDGEKNENCEDSGDNEIVVKKTQTSVSPPPRPTMVSPQRSYRKGLDDEESDCRSVRPPKRNAAMSVERDGSVSTKENRTDASRSPGSRTVASSTKGASSLASPKTLQIMFEGHGANEKK